jgi:hypothetical protein
MTKLHELFHICTTHWNHNNLQKYKLLSTVTITIIILSELRCPLLDKHTQLLNDYSRDRPSFIHQKEPPAHAGN